MRPVTRLCKFLRCSHGQQASALMPVGRQRQTGVFFRRVYMFLYKIACALLVLAFLLNANAEEGSPVPRLSSVDSTTAEFQLEGQARPLNSAATESFAIATRAAARIHSRKTSVGEIRPSAIGAQRVTSVIAIGSRRRDGTASIVQREDHQFYVVRALPRMIDYPLTPIDDTSPDSVDASPRVPVVQRVGNLYIDAALFQRSASSSNGGPQ